MDISRDAICSQTLSISFPDIISFQLWNVRSTSMKHNFSAGTQEMAKIKRLEMEKANKAASIAGMNMYKKANRHGFDLFFIFLRHFAIGSIWLELRKENHLQYFSLFFACSTHCFTSCIFFRHSRSFGITPPCSSLHGKTSPKMNS